MRIVVALMLLLILGGLVSIAWFAARGPSPAEAARISAVLDSTTPSNEPPAYAHCASCHLHDGSGRPDGSMPNLAGQRQAVLQNKLYRLRAGMMRMPVMDPYARTLAPKDITEIATYLSGLRGPVVDSPQTQPELLAEGASRYTEHCAACHGANGEGNDGLFAAKLCGQYAGYLDRRLAEARAGTRGSADAVMQGVVDLVPEDSLQGIVTWLAHGKGCGRP